MFTYQILEPLISLKQQKEIKDHVGPDTVMVDGVKSLLSYFDRNSKLKTRNFRVKYITNDWEFTDKYKLFHPTDRRFTFF